MTEIELKQIVARNLTKFRKANGLTQLELADKLNYSDKAVSKWERGESLPDIYMLKVIADLFGITLNDLISEETVAFKTETKFNNYIIILLSIGLTWLVAVTAAVALINLDIPWAWLAFIYAIPATGIVTTVLSRIYKYRALLYISVSSIYFTIPLAIYATSGWYGKFYLLFVVSGILEVLTILWIFRKEKVIK